MPKLRTRAALTLMAAAVVPALAFTPAAPLAPVGSSPAVAPTATAGATTPQATATPADARPTDPTGVLASDNMELLTSLPEPGAIGAHFRDEFMFVTSVSGLSVYDVSDAVAPVEVGRLPLPHFENEDVDLGGDILLISNDAAESYGMLYVIDISDPTAPALRSMYDTGQTVVTGATLGGPGHTTSCINDCQFAWMTEPGGYLVIDLRDPDAPVAIGHQPTPAGGSLGITHDVQVDADNIAWTVGFGGTAAFQVPADYAGEELQPLLTTGDAAQSRYAESFGTDDGSGVNDYIHHNSLRPAGSDTVYITEEDYNRPGCRGAGSFQRWQLPMAEDADGVMRPTGEDLAFRDLWVTELLAETAAPAAMCSAHYFDIRDGLVAQGWYEQGLRLLDVSGDQIRQVGFWVPPTAMTWAAYFPPTDATGQVVYAFDATHGIDVLRIDLGDGGVAGAATVVAPIREQWWLTGPAAAPGPFGYACRL